MAMLACARLGAVHSVVFGGFAAPELATRIDDAKPKSFSSASSASRCSASSPISRCSTPPSELASAKPEACLILQRDQLAAISSPAAITIGARPSRLRFPAGVCSGRGDRPALHPLYLGHDRHPEGRRPRQWRPCRRAASGRLQACLRRRAGRGVLDRLRCRLGGRPFVYRLCAASLRLYDGHVRGQARRHPRCRRLLAGHRRAWCRGLLYRADGVSRDQARGSRGRSSADTISRNFARCSSPGERADPPTVLWAEDQFRVPVIDHWWQTETGWPIAGNCLGLEKLPVKHGSATRAVPGWDVRVLDSVDGHAMRPGEVGALVVKLPLPPGSLPTLWQADDRLLGTYLDDFPGYYQTADAGYIDGDGYIWVMTRTDDIINVAGHRLSTGGVEEVLAAHPDVADVRVHRRRRRAQGPGAARPSGAQSGVRAAPPISRGSVVQMVRDRIGPVASFKTALVVRRAAETRSGKILRGTMRQDRRQPDPSDAGDDRRLGRPERDRGGATGTPGMTPRAAAGFPEVSRWPPPQDQLTTGA